MARFVSQYLKFSHGVRDSVPSHMQGNGQMSAEVRGLEAEFTHNGATPKDALVAKSSMKFTGVPQDEAGNDIDPAYRISVFDSEAAKLANGWSDDEEELVINVLRASGDLGRAFVEITPEPIEAPWPNYDQTDPEEIVKVAGLINADMELALAYEKDNQNRPGVIDALTEATFVEPTEVVRA
jgi:hypothetical protein